MRKCQQCGEDFTAYMGRQRFCCRECSDAWFAEERREAVRRYRNNDAPQSYFEMEAARTDATTTLIGSSQPPLAVPQWSLDAAALPPEPPLGWDVNETPDLGMIDVHARARAEQETRDAETET